MVYLSRTLTTNPLFIEERSPMATREGRLENRENTYFIIEKQKTAVCEDSGFALYKNQNKELCI